MGKNNQSYFTARAAEELAAAENATGAAAAQVHRELSLRYSLKLILPEPKAQPETRVFGMTSMPRPKVHSRPRARRSQQSR